jgi:hypothetical protein
MPYTESSDSVLRCAMSDASVVVELQSVLGAFGIAQARPSVLPILNGKA